MLLRVFEQFLCMCTVFCGALGMQPLTRSAAHFSADETFLEDGSSIVIRSEHGSR